MPIGETGQPGEGPSQVSAVSEEPDRMSDWTVIFASADPGIWDSDTDRDGHFAMPLSRVSDSIRWLRMRRLDTGDAVILPMQNDSLGTERRPGLEPFVWMGTARAVDRKGRGIRGGHLGNAPENSIYRGTIDDRPNRFPRQFTIRRNSTGVLAVAPFGSLYDTRSYRTR